MKNIHVMADSFVLEKRDRRIFRVSHLSGATILWLSRDDALDYLRDIQEEKLQVKYGR